MARPRSANPRSVLIALRVTPKVRYGLELLAQRERCSLSELVLRAIRTRIDAPVGGLRLIAKGERTPTSVVDRTWSPHEYEYERVIRLGILFPDLLSDEQAYLWRLIEETASYWKRNSKPKRPTPDDVRWEVVAKDWSLLKRRAGAT